MAEGKMATRLITQKEGKSLWWHEVFSLVLPLFLVSFGVFIYLWPHLHVVKLAYEFQEWQMRERALIQENGRLRTEIATLRSPRRIEQIARQKLGLVSPQNEQIILVKRRSEANAGRSTQ